MIAISLSLLHWGVQGSPCNPVQRVEKAGSGNHARTRRRSGPGPAPLSPKPRASPRGGPEAPTPVCVCCHPLPPAPLWWLVGHGRPGPQRPIFLLWGQRCRSSSTQLPRLALSGAAAPSVLPIVSLPKSRPHWDEGEGRVAPMCAHSSAISN